MIMEIMNATDPRFRAYGRIIKEYDCAQLMAEMEKVAPPAGCTYIASVPELEALPIFRDLTEKFYGFMPIQMGYCCGHGQKLNALEYHKGSEWNLACTDLILLLGREQDIDPETFTYHTDKVEAFMVKAGTAFETYSTTLHYAPCGVAGAAFKLVVVLPKGTNLPLPAEPDRTGEGKLMTDCNKWLIAHPESGLDPQKVHMGLIGENLTV